MRTKIQIYYSPFNTLAGLILAAFRICHIRVANDMKAVTMAAIANSHQDIGALLANPSRYFEMIYQDRGAEMMNAIPRIIEYFFNRSG